MNAHMGCSSEKDLHHNPTACEIYPNHGSFVQSWSAKALQGHRFQAWPNQHCRAEGFQDGMQVKGAKPQIHD